jgi:hypothetical protein
MAHPLRESLPVLPAYVNTNPGSVALIRAGGHHTCALLIGGSVQCWGRNSFGQLGVGDTDIRNAPTAVTGLGTGDLDTGDRGGREHARQCLQLAKTVAYAERLRCVW